MELLSSAVRRCTLRFAFTLFLVACGGASAALPDLIINRQRLATGIEVTTQYFSASDCAVIEGCVKSPGTRRLLLFEVAFANIGRGDLIIGAPHDNPHLFEHSPCHGHHHLSDAASYELLGSTGRAVLVGRKQAFCLRDNAPYSSSAGPSRGYDCDYQGITAGWEDIYPKNLDCQWLDITGLPGGTYTLKVTVNPNGVMEESNYGNNSASVTVTIPGAAPKPPPTVKPPPKKTPPKVHPPKHHPPKQVKKPVKPSKPKYKWWQKRGGKKPTPPPRHDNDDDDDGGGHDDDDD